MSGMGNPTEKAKAWAAKHNAKISGGLKEDADLVEAIMSRTSPESFGRLAQKARSAKSAEARGEAPAPKKKAPTKYDDMESHEQLHVVTHKRSGDIHRLVKQGDQFFALHTRDEVGAGGKMRRKTYAHHLGSDRKASAGLYNAHLERNGFQIKKPEAPTSKDTKAE